MTVNPIALAQAVLAAPDLPDDWDTIVSIGIAHRGVATGYDAIYRADGIGHITILDLTDRRHSQVMLARDLRRDHDTTSVLTALTITRDGDVDLKVDYDTDLSHLDRLAHSDEGIAELLRPTTGADEHSTPAVYAEVVPALLAATNLPDDWHTLVSVAIAPDWGVTTWYATIYRADGTGHLTILLQGDDTYPGETQAEFTERIYEARSMPVATVFTVTRDGSFTDYVLYGAETDALNRRTHTETELVEHLRPNRASA